jgi:uncharacterized protein YndB with AHSA1/START domain
MPDDLNQRMSDDLDLTLERRMAASPANVWRCMTEPELMKQWFAPRPWRVVNVEIDPRPGGRFYLKMQGPDGEDEECIDENPDAEAGCVLAAEPERRLVWTDGLGPEFRPKGAGFMTAELTLAPDGDGTHYRVRVLHKNREDRDRHEEMGFSDGWATCAAQLEEVAASLRA